MEKTLPTPRDGDGKEEVRETEIERDCRMMYKMHSVVRVVSCFFLRHCHSFGTGPASCKWHAECRHATANTQALAIARHCLPVRTKRNDKVSRL
jgi:hypothetical protein